MTIQIELASGSNSEQRLQQRLCKILDRYGSRLERWQFTDKVALDDKSISHSHPVLTIGTKTKAVKTDTGLLAIYLHEQIHWFLSDHPVHLRRAVRDLRMMYPQVRVGTKEGGARDEKSTYLHLLVCTLEYDALRSIMSKASSTRLYPQSHTTSGSTRLLDTILNEHDTYASSTGWFQSRILKLWRANKFRLGKVIAEPKVTSWFVKRVV